MIAAILFFLILCAGSAFACAYSETRFEAAAPVTTFGVIVLLYLFGLFGLLAAGAWVVLALSATLWAAAVVRTVRRRSFRAFSRRFFTPAFAFLGLHFFDPVFQLWPPRFQPRRSRPLGGYGQTPVSDRPVHDGPRLVCTISELSARYGAAAVPAAVPRQTVWRGLLRMAAVRVV